MPVILNTKEELSLLFARLDAKSSRESFGTCKGKKNAVFKGMLTTSNVSKLASLRQCEFCIDLSLNSGEQDTVKITSGEGSKTGEGEFLLSQAC